MSEKNLLLESKITINNSKINTRKRKRDSLKIDSRIECITENQKCASIMIWNPKSKIFKIDQT